ncbi:hypothetical protein [Novosphingobium sp. PC22D]|uniref:hypothetical protein n=1 Tax=Novosphingobium sp. PC22D TaxID=1962403 RepID=UPI00114557FC|nr:hypothetical protein [Novosphingobium sp. PC22D]
MSVRMQDRGAIAVLTGIDRCSLALVLLALFTLAGGFLASTGYFTVDEAIYAAGARAFAASGNFVIDNGLPALDFPDQHLWFFAEGPEGLVPQYPVGQAIAAAPFYALLGERGFILLNTLAGIAMIFVLPRMAAKWFGDERAALVALALLLGATFWIEFVFALWPHAVTVLCVTLALTWLRAGLDAETGFARKACGVGAAVGCAMLFRADTALALVGVGAVAVLLARRPFRLLTCIGLGVAPFLAFAALANLVKFGSLNPVSYGQAADGGTDLGAHLVPVVALLLVGLGAGVARLTGWRPGWRVCVAGGVLAVLALLIVPEARGLATRYVVGAWALTGDATTIVDTRFGMTSLPGGLFAFNGLWKKALGQSMPWLGILALAPFLPADRHVRRSQLAIAIFAAIWTLPFFLRSWHGGMGSNMRYFLPLVPLLCAMAAKVLVDLCRLVPDPVRALRLGAIGGAAAVLGWALLHPTGMPGAEQILSTWLLLGVTGLFLYAGLAGRHRALALAAVGAGLVASTIFAYRDVSQSQWMRAQGERTAVELAHLPDNALVYAPTRFLTGWAFRPGHVAALPDYHSHRLDPALIRAAQARGMRVFVWSEMLAEDRTPPPGPLRHWSGSRAVAVEEIVPERLTAQQ